MALDTAWCPLPGQHPGVCGRRRDADHSLILASGADFLPPGSSALVCFSIYEQAQSCRGINSEPVKRTLADTQQETKGHLST